MAGIELALWDIKAKALGVPVYELFGGPLRDTAKKHSRPGELGRLEISITPPSFDVPDRATIDAYAAAGVDRLVLRPRPEMDAAALERFAAETGRALGLQAA